MPQPPLAIGLNARGQPPLATAAPDVYEFPARDPGPVERLEHSREFQDLLHLTYAASHGQLLAVEQHHGVVAFEQRLQFFNLVKIDQGRTIDTEKLFGIELLLEGGQGFADDVI